MTRRAAILIASDDARLRARIGRLLGDEFDVAGCSHDSGSISVEVARTRPDVLIADAGMPLLEGLDAILQVHQFAPTLPVIVLAVSGDGAIQMAPVQGGRLGSKIETPFPSELRRAIRAAAPRVETPGRLTSREREVVQLLAEGKAMKQVADLLKLSTRTVAFHKYGVMRKLGLHSSAELVRLAVAQGLVA